MTVDDRFRQQFTELARQRHAQRGTEHLPGDGGGGTFEGMEPRIARLEAHVEHANKQLDRLSALPAEIARLQERVAHLPTKGFIVTAIMTAAGLLGALVLFADKLRALVA